ncbi:MAG: SLC13 family permease [Vicinamibacterales bacterium]|jgi:di/tricarboxylate transporter|nr:C4-dicarboxylate ABC transporter [Acidobacteriota bacterium]MDP7293961.1 SLC13 family permease [Vicinamibacterales bacterium]MDP7472482.1 SLC13 family permease [Vicinamibacterales bacterium]MDP7671312.1 SLC13 family permease [Vicinamibacterales bacterium]HJO38538.1 SLC13 family permease [Vicinamibacterales bacterium]
MFDAASVSLLALLVAIVVSCTIRLHVGFLAIALAWLVGLYAGVGPNQIMAGFPTRLFLTLAGVTLLFSQAQANGTLDRIARRAVLYCRGNVGVIPMMFFVLAFVLASIGPGNIASTAIIAPMAMAVAGQVGIPAFLVAIMVGNGANAGSLSPIAPTGVIVNGVMADVGLIGFEWHNYLNNMAAHTVIAFGAYFLLGGLKLMGKRHTGEIEVPGSGGEDTDWSFTRDHYVTMAVILALIVGVIFFGVNIGMGAFTGAILLSLFKVGDEFQAVNMMPWRVIMMVCGVTVLISLLDETGGLDLFTRLLAGMSTPESVTAVIAFSTGFISIYSSTSGVVLPAMLPTVPGLSEALGGVPPIAIASAMNVGGHIVDVSALSTLGALCLAAAPKSEDPRALFNKLMAWGLSMTVVGAAVCYLLFTVLKIGIG